MGPWQDGAERRAGVPVRRTAGSGRVWSASATAAAGSSDARIFLILKYSVALI